MTMTGRTTTLQALALIAIGSLIGYAAATSERSRTARAAPPPAGSGGAAAAGSSAAAARAGKTPNILVIFGDDIGISNLSAYSDGLMGYTTPNIDRIAREGLRFLHYY